MQLHSVFYKTGERVTIAWASCSFVVVVVVAFFIYKGCNALKGQEMDLNQSRAVGGNIFGPFQGS